MKRKFSTMDILAPITMKNAAKCDMQCELQNSSSIRSLNASRAGLPQHVCFSVLRNPTSQCD